MSTLHGAAGANLTEVVEGGSPFSHTLGPRLVSLGGGEAVLSVEVPETTPQPCRRAARGVAVFPVEVTVATADGTRPARTHAQMALKRF